MISTPHLIAPLQVIMRGFFSVLLLGVSFVAANGQDADAQRSGLISSLRFSFANQIDTSKFSTRDMSKPFYFRIGGSHNFGSYPFTVDIGSRFNVWLDERVPPGKRASIGDRSLAISLTSDLDQNVKDKIFLDAVPHQSEQRTTVDGLDNERFISFDMMLDRNYQKPLYWVIHFQAFQCCAGHPPFVIRVVPEQTNDQFVTMEFAIANNETEARAFGKHLRIGIIQLVREQWVHFTLNLKPSPCGDGASGKIAAWVDGAQAVNWSGCWGFVPDPASVTERGEVRPSIGFDIGVYRRRQPTTQTIYIDNILYGRTLDSVGR
ncbi:polysaccharide lyase [Bradyrhizobium sp. 186]|uniref:heparin lyase I family protein n=1 Tax=Bradyrhizobium sp. 186 TaxID=2782654 RepID=UPI002001B768|nr:heparin lyase I family protein [Bradyrhizobium sp. 186]UPK33964.1 polysaccharide lyase [Bradyrhizobium sp. 186]